MKHSYLDKTFLVLAAVCLFSGAIFAQKTSPKAERTVQTVPQNLIFAVMNDGKTLEPIGTLNGQELMVSTAGDGNPAALKIFAAKNYKVGTSYDLIFGGSPTGKVIVRSSDPASECGKNLAQTSLSPANRGIKGHVMALATNAKRGNSQQSFRRRPTSDERSEIETLVRAELKGQNVPESALRKLRYQNLTALDVDHDGNPEFVGSYWTETAADRRDLLFFIAEKNVDGTYSLTYKDYSKVTPNDLMSRDLKDLDNLGGELLLDVFDYDGDGVSEIFTVNQAFEGNNFYVYKRKDGKWERVFEAYNYHCAY